MLVLYKRVFNFKWYGSWVVQLPARERVWDPVLVTSREIGDLFPMLEDKKIRVYGRRGCPRSVSKLVCLNGIPSKHEVLFRWRKWYSEENLPIKNHYHLRLDGFQAEGSKLKKVRLFSLAKYHKSTHHENLSQKTPAKMPNSLATNSQRTVFEPPFLQRLQMLLKKWFRVLMYIIYIWLCIYIYTYIYMHTCTYMGPNDGLIILCKHDLITRFLKIFSLLPLFTQMILWTSWCGGTDCRLVGRFLKGLERQQRSFLDASSTLCRGIPELNCGPTWRQGQTK